MLCRCFIHEGYHVWLSVSLFTKKMSFAMVRVVLDKLDVVSASGFSTTRVITIVLRRTIAPCDMTRFVVTVPLAYGTHLAPVFFDDSFHSTYPSNRSIASFRI